MKKLLLLVVLLCSCAHTSAVPDKCMSRGGVYQPVLTLHSYTPNCFLGLDEEIVLNPFHIPPMPCGVFTTDDIVVAGINMTMIVVAKKDKIAGVSIFRGFACNAVYNMEFQLVYGAK